MSVTMLPSRGPAMPAVPRASQPVQAPAHAGWPLVVMFVFFPLWWLLGVAELVALAMLVPMVADLVRRPRIAVPRGMTIWLLFLVWVAAGVLVVQVAAPLALAGESPTRYVTWGYRLGWYLVATVTLLYVGNNRDLTTTRICRLMGWMFVTVTAGGLAGTLFPTVDFPSALELVLPRSLAAEGYVQSIVHPTLAQIQVVLGYEAPRPSAPFAFANTWGLNFACLLPFFLRGWLGRDAGWRRYVAPFVLLVAAVPVIFSANRGLWAALVVMAVFVAVRGAAMGPKGLLPATVVGAAGLVVVLALSPLGSLVGERLSGEHKNSNQGRTELATTTVRSVAEKAPLVGYGTTRQVQGNFDSIAGGATAQCPRCSPPSLGTQGQLSLVVFSQGFLAALLYVGFFVLTFLRHLRSRAPSATMCLAVLIASFVTMPLYNALGFGLVVIMVATAVLWRDDPAYQPVGAAGTPTLEHLLGVVTRRVGIVLLCAILGLSAGAAWLALHGPEARATVKILVPAESHQIEKRQGRVSIDTLGQLALSEPVLAATREVRHPTDDDGALQVLATANTRILHLVFTSEDPDGATAAVDAARSTFLEQYGALVRGRRADELERLDSEATRLRTAVHRDNLGLAELASAPLTRRGVARQAELRYHRSTANMRLRRVQRDLAELGRDPASGGRVVEGTEVTIDPDTRKISLASGLLVGFGVGVGLAGIREHRGSVLRRSRDVTRSTGLPIVAVAPGTVDASASRRPDLESTIRTLRHYEPDAVLAVGADGRTRATAHLLDAACAEVRADAHPSPTPGERGPRIPTGRVLLVVGAGTRASAVKHAISRVNSNGAHAIGAVFLP